MNCSTNFAAKMENKKMATKALEIMKSVLAQIDANGFEDDSRETIDRFADNLKVKGSEIIDTQSYGLMPKTYHIVLPEMFKAVARYFCFDKFTANVFFDSTYIWEDYEVTYENGELIINSLYHDACEEPYCEDCDGYYELIEEDGVEICCCECGHTIPVEEYKAACEQSFENVYAIL